jgi:hypothetical protein
MHSLQVLKSCLELKNTIFSLLILLTDILITKINLYYPILGR